jgi:prevent-host-death family protein
MAECRRMAVSGEIRLIVTRAFAFGEFAQEEVDTPTRCPQRIPGVSCACLHNVLKDAAQALTEGRYSVRLVHEVQVMSRKVTTLGVGAAREKLADVLNRVIFGGERVVLTRHRRPVAAVVSVLDLEALARAPAGQPPARDARKAPGGQR